MIKLQRKIRLVLTYNEIFKKYFTLQHTHTHKKNWLPTSIQSSYCKKNRLQKMTKIIKIIKNYKNYKNYKN